MGTKIEKALQHVLESDAGSGNVIDVVLRFDLTTSDEDSSLPRAERMSRRAKVMTDKIDRVLSHAGDVAGETPMIVTKQPRIGTAVVQAHASYLKALLDQPEVLGAMLNASDSAQN